ncbi:hypothetical protein COLO4_28664 [Corchorus olitorius]|uniref:Uncharacterized protein n=1 Tax=Corchorus olitorius TaxID=93759 RepID=A0A1R3HIX8_9ROSI|nr:hypothetical protein COLO4_28664 [Corchorus olitorius]
MLALRCLEELFGANNSLTNVAPPDLRVTFDLSLSCNDVLQQILREVSIPKLKRACPELLRWDVHPFIMHKRASLPKCALEQIPITLNGDEQLEDETERSTKGTEMEGDNMRKDSQAGEGKQISNAQNADIMAEQNAVMVVPSHVENAVLQKSPSGDANDLQVNAEKFKQDATCTVQSFEQIPIRLNGDEQLDDETERSTKVTEMEGDNMRKDSQAGEGNQMENAQNADMMVEQTCGANLKCSNDNLTGVNTVTVPANEVEVEEIAKEVVQPQDSDPPQLPASAVDSDGEESSTAANDKFIIPAYPIRAKKHEPKYTSPPIPQLRRKKLPWTKTEEEMLKKGVKKFGSYGGSMPWTKILDFGTSVFLKGRTAIDLKDKWRNMSKVSPRCK